MAASVLLDVREERLDAAAACLRLREVIGLQWTFLSAVQYLSGKSAIAAITALPADWVDAGRTGEQRMPNDLGHIKTPGPPVPDGASAGVAAYWDKPLHELGRVEVEPIIPE